MNERLLNQIKDWIKEGRSGHYLKQQYTSQIDGLLQVIFEKEAGDTDVALIATGGYGRAELSPFSDIDIMFFAPDRPDANAVGRVLYRLWDTRLDISHSCRNGIECVQEAFKDIRTRTSLLEARFIAGNRSFFSFFRQNVYPEILYKRQRDFVREKLREMEKRHLTSGDSLFLLEPNIKEGEGGLRDVHTAYWLSKVAFKSGNFSEFPENINAYERKRFLAAYDFLIRARFCLHLESQRKNDVLSFEFQKNVAGLLGFRDSRKFKAAERMMRYYYLKGRIISETASKIIAACSKVYVPVLRNLLVKKISPNFSLSGGRLVITKEDVFHYTPDRIMEAFYHYSKTGRLFSNALREKIRSNLPRINVRTRSSRGAISSFLEILRGGRVYETLREMHETGVLGRFIPEFGALRLLVVHEPYHMYTVDEHTLHAIKNLEELRISTYKSREDLHLIMNKMKHVENLYMALLFHDIGKAAGRHHEEEGYKRLKRIMERFNLDSERRLRIEFLVKNHILMSKIALKREADDPEVTAAFADAVGDIENLDAIYLLTYADMSAVNPGFWTSWKAYLLRELYDQTRKYLSGKVIDLEEYIAGLRNISPEADPGGLAGFIEEMPERYFLATTRGKVVEDYKLARKVMESGFAIRIDHSSDGFADICVSAQDSPGLFSKIVGYLSSKGLNIVNGRIFTGQRGIVIDKISISNWKEVYWSGLDEDIESGLRAVITGGKPVSLFRRSEKSESPFDIFIEMDNEASEEYSIIEIFSPDRLGLLYDISEVMHRREIDITSARINTEAGLAQDIFYVRSRELKLDYVETQELLAELWAVLEGTN